MVLEMEDIGISKAKICGSSLENENTGVWVMENSRRFTWNLLFFGVFRHSITLRSLCVVRDRPSDNCWKIVTSIDGVGKPLLDLYPSRG
jgi:hypothetical protein